MPLQPKRAKIVLISVGALAGLTLLAWVGFNVLLGSPEAEAEFTASETLPGAGGNDSEKGDSQDGEEDQMTPPQGTWVVSIDGTGDSAVGYRILEDVPVGGPEEITGRTSAVSGSLTLEGTSITQMGVTVDMTALDSGLELRDNVVGTEYLETDRFPEATFTISDLIQLPRAAEGESVEFEVGGELTIHGVTSEVIVTGRGLWNPTVIEVVGTVDTTLSTFGVTRPDLLGRTARDEVVVEFKLQFVPQPA